MTCKGCAIFGNFVGIFPALFDRFSAITFFYIYHTFPPVSKLAESYQLDVYVNAMSLSYHILSFPPTSKTYDVAPVFHIVNHLCALLNKSLELFTKSPPDFVIRCRPHWSKASRYFFWPPSIYIYVGKWKRQC